MTQGKTVAYARVVAKLRPQKSELERVRITVGGNLIDYPVDKSTPTTEITTIKMHLNSAVSTPEAKCICTDVQNFYLNKIMEDPEYMRIKVELVPVKIIYQYELWDKVHDGHVYMKIVKGMYRIPQAGIMAYKKLVNHLKPYGYEP